MPIQIHRNSPAKGGLKMGQVSILRRGESLPEVMMCGLRTPKNQSWASATAAADDLLLFGMGRLGPEPASLPIFWQDPYAGPACINSPAPSDVPLPSFKKKTASRIVDDSATRDLRRFLGLD